MVGCLHYFFENMMKILYVSNYCNKETLEFYNKKGNLTFSPAAIKYSYLIYQGLKADSRIVLSSIFAPSFGDYLRTKILFFRPIYNKNENCRYLSCINIPVLKQIAITILICIYALIWLCRNFFSPKKIVVLSSLQLPFLLGVIPLKLFGIKIVSFVPDLPSFQYEYSSTNINGFERILLPIYKYVIKKMCISISYYVFITKYMKEKFPSRPFSIMEGMVPVYTSNYRQDKLKIRTIMYAGSLYRSMGIGELLDAISLLEKCDVQFLFFGDGDMKEEIIRRGENDNRIVYGGMLSNNQIIEYEQKVHLLINPRPTKYKYTEYSFPSKLMEYMQSGTPVLTTRLAGISEDYFDKMYFIDDETPNGMKDAIEFCLAKSDEELSDKGKIARSYVIKTKNCVEQMNRVFKEIEDTLFVY